MTLYDDPNDEQDVPASMQDAPEVEPSQSDSPAPDAPAPETPPAPEPTSEPEPAAPPVPNLTEQMTGLVSTIRADYERRQQEAEQSRQAELQRQAEAARPRPLMEQDEWRTRYDAALERSSFDPDARRLVASMNQELAREQAQALMAQTRDELRLEMQADNLLRSAAREALTPYGGLLTEADFQAEAERVFGGDRAALAQALRSPQAAQLRETLADAAMGRAFRAGRIQQPTRATPPANPRSAARPAPAAPAPVNEVTDPDAVMAALWD